MARLSFCWLFGVAFIFLTTSADSKAAAPLTASLHSEEANSTAQDLGILLNYRLPNETYPEHYDIKITTDIHLGEKAFQGEVVIDIVVAESTSSVVLHARQINITKANIVNPVTGESEELAHEYELEREFLTLKCKSGKQFETGTKWKLIIFYDGQLRNDLQGFHAISYVDEDGKDRFVALTQFESTNARHAFPCYDEPAKRAKFTITINHSPNLTAISNMPVNEQLSSAGKTVFLTTKRIPTYIVAFVVCDFEYTELIYNGVRQRVYSRSNRTRDHQFSLVNGMLFMNYLSKYTGINYMAPKLDQVALTQFKTGGMENWGLITYPEYAILFNEKTRSTESQTNTAKTVAHEVAHQWFGDYVTVQWWSNLWLKEGFATLFAYKAMENVFPEWNVWQSFHVIDYQRALVANGGRNSPPMTSYVQKPSEIASKYNPNIAYFKAAAVLLMWQSALGEEVFRRALQNFLKNNQYSAASEEDLFTEMQKSADLDNLKLPASMSEMMKTWTHQGGLPILTVTRNYTDGTFTVQQQAFFNNKSVNSNKTWYVPINFASAAKPDFRDTKASHYLPNLREMKVDAQLAKDDWIVLNKRSEYFYRIQYDEENYKLITQALIDNPFKIHSRNRAQLLDDVARLSFSNRLNPEVLLEMLTYLEKEDQYAPWQTARSIISKYKKIKGYTDFRHFITKLVSPIYKKLGIDNIPGEHHYDKYTRTIAIDIACNFGLEECLMETNRKLKAYVMQNETIKHDLEHVIYSTGLIQAGDNVFYFFYQKFLQAPSEDERFLFLYYLRCSREQRHIKTLLSSLIDTSNKLLPTERQQLLQWIYPKSEKNLLTCIEFLSENWDAYGKLGTGGNGSNPLDIDIRDMATYVFNKNVENQLLALVKKVKESKHVSHSLESDVKKEIAGNYQWLREQGQTILRWISQYLRAF